MLGLTRHTVPHFPRAATPGQMIVGPHPRSSGQDHFAADLQQAWNQGCTDAALLHAEIAAQGYQGSKRPVRRYRQPLPVTLTASGAPARPPTVWEFTRWITSHPGHLTEDETARLAKIKARSPQLNAIAGHVTAFAEMMTGRLHERLPAWITAVERDDLPCLHGFTWGIRRDQTAVANGLTFVYSSGTAEGNIRRVKALKRQMSGRACLDLVRKRILLST
jgi:transposase